MKVISKRFNSRGEELREFLSIRESTPSSVFFSLLKWELGYGGNLVEFKQFNPGDDLYQLTVETRILNKLDKTTYMGSKSDFMPIQIFLSVYFDFMTMPEQEREEYIWKAVSPLKNSSGTIAPGHLIWFGSFVVGHTNLLNCLLSIVCDTTSDISKYKDKSIDDLIAASYMIISGEDKKTVLELL